MKYEVPNGAKITWVGRLDSPDFRGWTVNENSCVSIDLVNGERFRITFLNKSIVEIPVEGTGFRYMPKESQQRNERRIADKKDKSQ